MKIICHLLVVIVVVCYSGLCSHASQPINKPESKQSSCHSQSSVEKPNTKNSDLQTLITKITNNNDSDPNCCIITLTNAPNNNHAFLKVSSNSVFSFSPNLRGDIVFIEKFGNYSNKHDPTDVKILKSSILL